MAWRAVDRAGVQPVIVAGRRAGLSLAAASAAAGVHVATVCRWQNADPAFAAALQSAEAAHAREKYAARIAEYERTRRRRLVPPPVVAVHPDCPECRSPAVRRRARWGYPAAFWGCSSWPLCPWGSWRPRHAEDCGACGGPRYWSHSRLTVSCPRCRTRRPACE